MKGGWGANKENEKVNAKEIHHLYSPLLSLWHYIMTLNIIQLIQLLF